MPFRCSTVISVFISAAILLGGVASAHHLDGIDRHAEREFVIPFHELELAPGAAMGLMARVSESPPGSLSPMSSTKPWQIQSFAAFQPKVRARWDDNFCYIESDGLPTHPMMVGITAWQQQVPVPQAYTGANAWRIPRHPVVSEHPVSVKGRFLRGAIAIAANGIPIFNPQNNRGEISQEIGELDQWGGHCGRADDYHYHATPFHLQSAVGPGSPIAFALDGFPIFGLTEPDGTAPEHLDSFNGHETPALGYHYHGSTRYPYVIGGFHGVVTEREGQVDPQPRAQPVRPDLRPLRGATITGFTSETNAMAFRLSYTVGGRTFQIRYGKKENGPWTFRFMDADGTERVETYETERRGRSPGGGPRAGDENSPALADRAETERPIAAQEALEANAKPHFQFSSPAIPESGTLPVEFTGDGEGATLPLDWKGEPIGTKSFALVMHHLDPEGKTKCYWTLYNIPGEVHHLARNVQGVGILGSNSINRRVGYAPPHSKGPGAKTYVLTLYALSGPLEIGQTPSDVDYNILLTAMKDRLLATADLRFVYTRRVTEGGKPN